ncbi:hypothetical protein D3C72_2190920 [compost metagenome]
MKSAVPDLAMVPRWVIASSRLMPIPLSSRVTVLASLSKLTRIFSSAPPSSSSGLARASKRNLSTASEAFEINSRRKISLLEYSEWIMRCSSCFTSVWKPRVSF